MDDFKAIKQALESIPEQYRDRVKSVRVTWVILDDAIRPNIEIKFHEIQEDY